MRGLLVVAVVVGWALPAAADPAKPVCQRAAQTVTVLIKASDKAQTLIGRRCEKDRWSRDAQACFAGSGSSVDAQRCLDKLSKDQRTQLEGDADRLNDSKLTQWLAKRVMVARALPPPTITLAVLDETDLRQARLLQQQGMSAYQAGRYDYAVRKFSAALDTSPTPELLYHAAQAYRLKGDRAKAIELYEKYLDVSPRGPAANASRAELEKLRDAVP
ncbi:MAG TPA: tetratricopeptide repeat protein [Kofleriaceae bacterium]|nr:tetratricopeptide repeat protein [Kofleriaceae bacterium]